MVDGLGQSETPLPAFISGASFCTRERVNFMIYFFIHSCFASSSRSRLPNPRLGNEERFSLFLIVTWEQTKHLLIHVVVSGVRASEQEKYFLIVASIWFHLICPWSGSNKSSEKIPSNASQRCRAAFTQPQAVAVWVTRKLSSCTSAFNDYRSQNLPSW